MDYEYTEFVKYSSYNFEKKMIDVYFPMKKGHQKQIHGL